MDTPQNKKLIFAVIAGAVALIVVFLLVRKEAPAPSPVAESPPLPPVSEPVPPTSTPGLPLPEEELPMK